MKVQTQHSQHTYFIDTVQVNLSNPVKRSTPSRSDTLSAVFCLSEAEASEAERVQTATRLFVSFWPQKEKKCFCFIYYPTLWNRGFREIFRTSDDALVFDDWCVRDPSTWRKFDGVECL